MRRPCVEFRAETGATTGRPNTIIMWRCGEKLVGIVCDTRIASMSSAKEATFSAAPACCAVGSSDAGAPPPEATPWPPPDDAAAAPPCCGAFFSLQIFLLSRRSAASFSHGSSTRLFALLGMLAEAEAGGQNGKNLK